MDAYREPFRLAVAAPINSRYRLQPSCQNCLMPYSVSWISNEGTYVLVCSNVELLHRHLQGSSFSLQLTGLLGRHLMTSDIDARDLNY
jgi:hypothetical protein